MSRAILILFFNCSFCCFSQTQFEMNRMSGEEFIKSDSILNDVYSKIILAYKSDTVFIDRLERSQRIWKAFRSAELEMKYPEKEKRSYYGAVYPMCVSFFLKDITDERIEKLRVWLDGIEEGNVCTGSVKVKQVIELKPTEKKIKNKPEKLNSSCSHPEHFDFKKYKEYCLTDTLKIDLNGNGILESVFFSKNKNNILIKEKGKKLISLSSGGNRANGFYKNYDWVNLWCVVSDSHVSEVIVKEGELLGDKILKLERPSIYIGKETAGGGIITYRNGKLYWVHQSD